MRRLWYLLWRRFCTGVYFARVRVRHAGRLPRRGPALYLGLHRNGAVDGFIYQRAVPRATFLISSQLRQHAFARLFFDGIEVTRAKDAGDRAQNLATLRTCVEFLQAGGELCVFPEGTSALGPRHLPFKSGAAQVLLDYLEAGGQPLPVIPLGIHYECPWGFRSKVEVVVGDPIATDFDAALSPFGRRQELKRRMQAGLEAVGINVATAAEQERIQCLAYAATLGTARSYFHALKALERGVPAPVRDAWDALAVDGAPATDAAQGAPDRPFGARRRTRRVWLHQGVPLVSRGSWVWDALALLALGPAVLGGIVLNLPPFLAAAWAGRRFPDGRNVVALWRILVGLPLFALWIVAVATVATWTGQFAWLAGYGVVTWLGLHGYGRVKQLGVAVHNGLCHATLRPRFLALREVLRRH